MAELAASMVVAPLVSLLKAKVSSYLLDQYNVMEGMEEQHNLLKRKLPAILDIMADAEKQASHRGGVKAWLDGLKTVAYKANDVFDEFEYEALRRRANKEEGHITKLGVVARVKLFPTHNRVAFRNRMGNRLRSIVQAIEVLMAEMNTFGFKHQIEAPARKESRETSSNINHAENAVGSSRDVENEKIVNILVNGNVTGGDLLVVPIVGMGGLGKTTLAQLIYNDRRVQETFQLRKWVCVSDDFNVGNLASKIVCNSHSEETPLDEALKKLQQHLAGKRYLLVLDDVWNKNRDKWEMLKACLKQGVNSAILTTTRDKAIAQFMGTVVDNSWRNSYHELGSLPKEHIQKIIETRAFGLGKSKPELAKLVDQIAERCVGSPLAAKAIGSVLRDKTTMKEWEDVLKRLEYYVCDEETGIMPILKLSYSDLPIDMKQCFAFCALYPKDYQIDVDQLIQLWMANGYISDLNTVPAETMGKRIVNEMVSRSFFQYEEQRRIGCNSTTFVKIHDLMHDVALSAMEKECLLYTGEEICPCSELLPSAARHIFISSGTYSKGFIDLCLSMRKMSLPIQTLLMIDKSYYRTSTMQHFSNYSSLRALSIPRLRGHFPKPKHMLHLRFLDIPESSIKELPDDISILYNLQTLKLSGCNRLKRLPEQMKYMTALRHLYTDGCDKLKWMPPNLGKLTSLRTITWFLVGSGSNCSSLEELKNLNIGGSLMLKQLENVTGGRKAKAANLENKKELRQLSLEWTSGREEEQQCHEVLESLKAHDGLLALGIYSYKGTSFPSWMGMLKNMVELRLSNCSKAERLPELLEQLAELQLLHLKGLGKLQFLCSRCTPSTFGKLKDLKLVNLDVFYGFCQTMDGDVVAFPQLEILHIEFCKNLAALPKASALREPYGGGDDKVARSAFPELKSLRLEDLCSFERWETTALEIEEKDALLFPSLEIAFLKKCPKLTTLPRAPKLRELNWYEGIGYMTSLSSGHLDGASCSLFFQPRAIAQWVCYGQLQVLEIVSCDELVYWPEKVFQSLISLRRLQIWSCNNLIGYASENGPDQATSSARRQLLPHLEFLRIYGCQSLVEVFNVSPALKTMQVEFCDKLESLCGKQQLMNQEAGSTNDVTASEEKLSPSVAPDNLLPSSLESLTIWNCDGLSEAVNLPSSLRQIYIDSCSKLRFVSSSGQLDALQELIILRCPELRSLESLRIRDLSALEVLCLCYCRSLASLPSAPEPQEYSSLRRLRITKCPGIKSLPSALQQRLDSGLVVDSPRLDSRCKGRFPRRLLGRLCPSL